MATRKKTTETEVVRDDTSDIVAPVGGAAAGMASGAAIGAVAGGPVGAVAGAAIGGVVGGALGAAATYTEAEPYFREHWEKGPYRENTTWEQASPAYRYGFESFEKPEYKGKSYDEVRSE